MRIIKKIFIVIFYLFLYFIFIPILGLPISTLILTLLLFFLFRGDVNKKCSWCGSKKITFKNGEEGEWYWEYRNKNGSKDRRVKDNFQQAGYFSEYTCEKCGAETHFNHLVNRKPSRYVKVWKRTLVSQGSNDRKGTDWKSKKIVTIHTDGENRKNN